MNKKASVYKEIYSASIAAVCLLSMYIFPETVKTAVSKSLQICGNTLIPSLFPFITCTRICSELIIRHKKSSKNRFIPIINVSLNGLIIFILGLISGFPGGAVLAGSAYSTGAITKKEAQRITAFSNSVSPPFCIMVFGNEVMKNELCGITVLTAIVAVNIIFFIISGFVSLSRDKETQTEEVIPFTTYKKTNTSSIIADSSVIMLNICAFVTYFYCLGNLIHKIFSLYFKIPSVISAVLYSSLEISGGIVALNELSFGQKFLYGSMLLGFGGVSAIMQVWSVCEKFGLTLKGFIFFKISCAITVPLISALLSPVFTEIIYRKTNFKHLIGVFRKTPVLFMSIIFMFFLFVTFMIISRYKDYKKSKLNF